MGIIAGYDQGETFLQIYMLIVALYTRLIQRHEFFCIILKF